MPEARRTVPAILGGLGLVGVAVAALWAGRGSNWGRIHACAHCDLAGQPLAQGWVEVPPNDAWAVELETGLGVVVRGPARFEVAGPKPGEWRLALSRGALFAQSAGAGKVVVLLPRDPAEKVEGATVSTGPAASRMELDAEVRGNLVHCGAGSLSLVTSDGARTLETNGHWESGCAISAAPSPSSEEQTWLDEMAKR